MRFSRLGALVVVAMVVAAIQITIQIPNVAQETAAVSADLGKHGVELKETQMKASTASQIAKEKELSDFKAKMDAKDNDFFTYLTFLMNTYDAVEAIAGAGEIKPGNHSWVPGVQPAVDESFFGAQPVLDGKPHVVSRLCDPAEMSNERSALNVVRRDMLKKQHHHRKNWEFAVIIEALEHFGLLGEGKRGLGFGCGMEPLASYFVQRGARVVVTDAPAGGEWTKTRQHAGELRKTHDHRMVDWKIYSEKATFQALDMNNIPSALLRGDFDFTWSAGSLEHVGSEELSVKFIATQLLALRPGGVAAHTTEFVISDSTLQNNIQCSWMNVFTKPVWERIIKAVNDNSHGEFQVIGPMDYRIGLPNATQLDYMGSYRGDDHFRLQAACGEPNFIHTSALLLIRRRTAQELSKLNAEEK